MIPNLFTGQPSWLIIFCLLLAGVYAIALYFREIKNEFPLYLKVLLGTARFIAIFLISFMLLSPFIRSISKEKEKPLIIFALDNSQSVLLNADSNQYRGAFLREADRISDRLSAIAEVRQYIYGNSLGQIKQGEDFSGNVTYNDKVTDISGMIAELSNLYTNLNVGALILASDGIYNTGTNPVYQAKEWPHPVYTIALGDTSSRMDLILAKVNFNRMVFLNNKFPVEVVIRAYDAAGKSSRIKIFQDNNLLQSQDFSIDKNDFTQSIQFVLDAKRSGLQKYQIVLEQVEGEVLTANNRKEIFIEVLDARSKVLLISGAPHPDISALNQAITSNMNYEVDEVLLEDFNGKLEDYSMVILHQLPSVNNPADQLLRSVAEKQIPALFILGLQSDFARFNQLNPGLKITTSPKPVFEESIPFVSQGFTAFSLTENTRAWLSDLPPLICPLGDYQVANSSRILMKQRIGSIETSRPMILLSETLDGRSGVISGEGLWKWRLYNYARTKDHQAFNELVNKIVQYLSLKDQKKNFRIYSQTSFRETEPVIFDAEVYNESYELTNEPEVELIIKNEEDRQFPFVFNKTGNAYHLDAGNFPPGNYTYQAQAVAGNNIFSAAGQFSVSAIDLEALNIVADHQLLYQLAEGSGGKMFYPANLDQLADDILAREDIRPVTYTRKKYEDLLNNGWILAVIIGLLTMEWFLRKRAGSY
ncbi:MAG: hypothetical protein HGA23_04000 [Bacteroidales bacterium]|nr:hypothetical protein [Bacteroidales bacterium]